MAYAEVRGLKTILLQPQLKSEMHESSQGIQFTGNGLSWLHIQLTQLLVWLGY